MATRIQDAIPIVDLRAQYAGIRDEIRAAVDEVLDSQQFILGPQLRALEEEVARYCGCRFAVGVASGTDALILALRACNIGPADGVIVPAFSFIATAGAVSVLWARPTFIDIDPQTYNIDPAQIEARITSGTKAVIPVHLYGLPADMDPILEIAKRRGLRVIEDNAQAIGATYKGRKTASMGDLGCLSFYPSKNLGACGDAGMVVTDSEELAERVRTLRDHGQKKKYVSEEQGWNSRLDEIQAAVLRVKLRHLDAWKTARQAHAASYNELLRAVPGVVTPHVPAGTEHVYHQYTIRIAASSTVQDEGASVAAAFRPALRERVQKSLAEQGISTNVYYPVPLHLQPIYTLLNHRRGSLPQAERAAAEVLSLPMYPELTPEQIERVARTLISTVKA